MNTTQRSSRKETNPQSRIVALIAGRPVAAAVTVIVVAALLAVILLMPDRAESQDQLYTQVKRGPLVISVSESGAVKSREKVVLKCDVEGRTTILSLIPEGTSVKRGDLLVELDASNLEEQKTSQEITVLNAEASFIRAKENLEVTKSQGASDIARAELDYRFAQVDLKKYIEGEYPKELEKAGANITLANEELQRAIEEYDWSAKLKGEGYITETELKADELAKTRSELNLKQAETDMNLLQEYTYPRQLDQLNSDVEQTNMALDRVKRKASADLVQAEADLKARESEFNRQKTKLEKAIDQIAKCRITAPVDGMVVYATTGQANRRGNTEPLEEGQEVRERQELIHLPTASAMMAEIRVQESSLRKVAVGMPVRVSVDALPGKVIYGRIAKIGLLPDAQSAWLNPDLTVYSTEINLENAIEGLRPGMTCRAEIIVERHDEALYVPVQTVTRVDGKPTVYVKAGSGSEARTIETGLDNNRVIHVIAGVDEGEWVLMKPPLAPASLSPENSEAADELASMPAALRESIGRQAVPGGEPGEASAEEAAPEGGAGEIDFSKLETMTREERRAFMEKLTPEQREAMRGQFGGGRGGRGGRGTEAGAGPGGDSATSGEADGGGTGNRRGRGTDGTSGQDSQQPAQESSGE